MQQPPVFIHDDSTISLLYQRYAPVILVYVRRLVPSWEDAEDIVLEVFLAALEQEKLLAELSEFARRAWLRRVAHNKVVDLYRKSSAVSAPPFEAIVEGIGGKDLTPEQAALQQEEYMLLRRHLASLSKTQQEVVQLRFEAGLRCKEIAVLLQKPEGTVRSLLSRSLNFLRRVYQDELGG